MNQLALLYVRTNAEENTYVLHIELTVQYCIFQKCCIRKLTDRVMHLRPLLSLLFHGWTLYLLSLFIYGPSSMVSSMNTGGRSYYNVLNVPTDAKDDDIKKAYRKLAMKVMVDIPTVDHEHVLRHMSHFTCGGW